MRLDRAWIVAKKDLAEFAKNRYIMMTIVLMPMFVAVLLPVIYVVPINQLARQSTGEVDLVFDIQASYSNMTLQNSVMYDIELDNVTVKNSILSRCVVRSSAVENSSLTESMIVRSEVRDTMLYRCYLVNLTVDDGNTLRESKYEGGSIELENLKAIMFNVLLILLIMTPVMIPTVTASYSFVGEKVNRSLEPLLATPATDLELLVGKSGSIFLVSMGSTWLAFALAVVMVDLLTQPVLGYYPLPNSYWVVGILLLAPGMCLMSILTNVIISSKVNDVRVSQQIGGVLVLPILLFFFFTLAGFLSTDLVPMFLFSFGVLGADLVILWISLRVFNREEILVSWK